MELQEILKSLKELSAKDLMILNKFVCETLYAKGVVDYIQSANYGKLFRGLPEDNN